MKRILLVVLLLLAPHLFAKTVQSVSVLPHGAVLQNGSSLQFSATCAYTDGSSDNCAAAGGVAWSSSRPSFLSVNTSGVAAAPTDPGVGGIPNGFVLATVGGQVGRGAVYVQHAGDTWYEYMTPDVTSYKSFGQSLPATLVVGSTVALGAGVVANYGGAGSTGVPIQTTCNWSSSNPAVATVNDLGDVTGVGPGSVNITCGRAGNGRYGTSSIAGWIAPGNVVPLTVANGGTSNTTWYIRPDGGTPFVSASSTPNGQCDGKHDAAYPGAGVNQPCGLANLNYLWLDTVTYGRLAWMIQGGDTVIVHQNVNGYSIGSLSSNGSPNCPGDAADCYMPTIPSGTAARHTRILGANYGSCHDDSAKTKLLMNDYEYGAINIRESQFVDVSCFEITDTAACAYGNFTNNCSNTSGAGNSAVLSSALAAQDTLSDLFIHGLAGGGWLGAVGTGVVVDHLHVRASPSAGIEMDDDPWSTGNISVAGGFALTNSLTEFTGCVEEYPVVHNYPYIECRDQNIGGYGDGLGTASTSGDWLFDHDVWRYNFQDGLDLLHSGMHTLTVTNSQSYGNDGQQFKIGSGDNVLFANNLILHDCQRILQPFGDEPASAVIPGVAACRAAGDGILITLSGSGSDTFYNNTYVGYGTTSYDMACEGGYDSCTSTHSLYRNNLNLGLLKPSYNPELPGLFYAEQPLPANGGWAVRDHNLYYNFRNTCPTPLGPGEICADPRLVNEPSLTISDDTQLDNFDFALSSSSPARFAGLALPLLTVQDAGVTLSNLLEVDQFGTPRPNPPSLGGEEIGGSAPVKPSNPISPVVTLSVTPNPVITGTALHLSATVSSTSGNTPTGSVTFVVGSATTSAQLNNGVASATITAPNAGSFSAEATYSGDSNFLTTSSSPVALTVSPIPVAPPTPPTTPTPPTPPNPPSRTPPSRVSLSVAQPQFGFNLIPGATRRLYATVQNGTTNGVSWTVKSGGASLSSVAGPWVDVTAPATGSLCQASRGTTAGVASATQFVIEATSQDDTTQTADITVNVCNPSVELSVVPAYRTLFSGQLADLQSLVVGSVDTGVTWAITATPQGGDGALSDTSHRDTVFAASVPGRYTITATSNASQNVVATSTLYVTGNPMPYPVTLSRTEPVDCTVDPALRGVTYDVGPSQQYHRLQDVPLGSLAAGSTIRLHNEDTSGANPTVFSEAIQIPTSATADQPVRLCGVPDKVGNLPIMDATNAVFHPDAAASVAGQALISLAGNDKYYAYPIYSGVEYVQVEGIHLRNARPSASFTTTRGTSGTWSKNASCLLVNAGHGINVVGVEMEGCVNGGQSTWIASQWNGSSLNHLWEGNHIHGNGLPGSTGSQLTTQAWGNVVQFNSIDNIVPGSLGDDLRSKGVLDVIRYNYLGDGASHLLNLTEVGIAAPYLAFTNYLANTKTGTYTADDVAAWQQALNAEFVYGNSYVNSASARPIHYGYDKLGGEVARKGDLFWYSNTLLQTACASCSGKPWTLFDQSGSNGVFQPQVEFPTAQVFNNLIWMSSAMPFQWNNFDGFTAVAGKNILPKTWGANTMKGGTGDGWNDVANPLAFQGAVDLASHLSGFDATDLLTPSSAPLNLNNLVLNTAETASTAVPAAVCNMPNRFSYLPASGVVTSRVASPNIGATDAAGSSLTPRATLVASAAGCQ